MKTYMITLLLLVFEINLIFGHTLSKIELVNETEKYEIKEDQSALLITHPKDEATKLREIIYYHIIERPYDAKDISHDKIEPDFEKRFLTNSHSGIQFEKKECDDDDDEDESTSEELDEDSSNSTEETDEDINSSESNEERDIEQPANKNNLTKDKINDEDKPSSNRYGDNDSVKNDKSDVIDSPIDADSIKSDIRFSDFVVNTTEGDAKDIEQPANKNDLSKDKINDEDKPSSNRYGDNDSVKNDKSDVIDSPIDADSIKIDIRFSDFVVNTTEGDAKVKSATTNVTAHPETKTEAISETLQSRRKREINHTVTRKDKSAKTGEGLNHADGKSPKREGGTYGMSLTGNRGVVWNDVKPTNIEYHVGKPDVLMTEDITTTESAKDPVVIQEIDEDYQDDHDGDDDEEDGFIETFADIEKIFDKLMENINKTDKSESKQENKTVVGAKISIGENKHEDDNEHDNEDSSLNPIEIEKSFIEIFKVFKELTGNDTNNQAVTGVNDATKSADDADISEEKVSGELSNGNILRTTKEDEEDANDTSFELGAKLAPKRNEKDKETTNKEKDNKQQQFEKELLKNKYFWAWLKDASGTYLEILMKKLDAVIETEVGKQIEQYFKEHNNENCKQDKIDHNNVQEPVQTSNVTDENAIGNTSSTDHNGLASNDTKAESINESKENTSETSTKKHKDKPSDDKNAETSVKIETQNLLGSSVGSGNVTNIFIYNINKAFDLENIKPIKNGTNGVFVFGLDDTKPGQEKEGASDKDTMPKVETVKPDISSEHDKIVDKVTVTHENQTSTVKQETEKDHQINEKDKIEDKDQVQDKDNVEHSTDKNEVIPNDQTSTEANNNDKTSTEINKESESITEKPQEAIKDDKEKNSTTEKVETKKDLNDSGSA